MEGNVVQELAECRRLAIELRKRLRIVSRSCPPPKAKILPLTESVVVGLVSELKSELSIMLNELEL